MPAPSDATGRLAPELAELGAASGEETASATDGDAAPRPALPAGRWARAALCAAGAAALCGLLALGAAGHRGGRPQQRRGRGSEVVSLGLLGALADVLESGSKGIDSLEEGVSDVGTIPGEVSNVTHDLGDQVTPHNHHLVATGPFIEALQNGTFYEMLQSETGREKLKAMLKNPDDLHDGNFCEDDEEEHGSLCYKKCALLTDGDYPIRSTAFSCCKKKPCTLANTHFTSPVNLCQGLDVSGDTMNNACPHERGGCLADEEVHLDICYRKCAILTNGTHAWRSGPETCCRFKGNKPCLEANASVTDARFDVGGGLFDNLSALNLTANMPHHPLVSITEVP